MVELIKKIFAIVLALVVMISTSGFHIYEHHCNCCKTSDYSLVEFSSGCDHRSEFHDDFHDVTCTEEGCCDTSHADDQQNHICTHDECCNFDNKYEKLTVDFDKSQTVSIKYFPQVLNVIQEFNAQILTDLMIQKLIHISQNAPPIFPKTDFVIFGHALKIPF